MIKTENLGYATRIYSDMNLPIKDLSTGHIHSEYVVKKPNIENYIEVVAEQE